MTDLAHDLDELVGPAPKLQLVSDAPVLAAANPVRDQFERCKEWIAQALVGGRHTLADVEGMITQGKAQLWPGHACVIVTEIHQFSTHKAIQCWLAAGDMAEILTLEPGIQAWARLVGCTEVLIEGRRGWEKALRPAGYELWSICLRKAL